jgi:hypothetical protein
MQDMARIVVFLMVVLVSGCGGGGSGTKVESCTSNPAGPGQFFCIEYDKADPNSVLVVAKDLCHAGTWASRACSMANTLGGCAMPASNTPDGLVATTVWYYPGVRVMTEADVMAECMNTSATFLPP